MMEAQKQWVNVNGKWQHIEVPAPASATPQVPQRPQLPARPAAPPKLPPRTAPAPAASDLAPPVKTLPVAPRRPSEQALTRRESNESLKSSATTETSISVRSTGTSFTSSSDRYTIRAPEYDPAALPKLPPRRTQEEKDAQAKLSKYASKSARKTSASSTSSAGIRMPLTAHALERAQSQPPPALPSTNNLPEEADVVQAIPIAEGVAARAVVPSGLPAGAFRLPSLDKPGIQKRLPPPDLPRRPAGEAPALPRRQPAPAPETVSARPQPEVPAAVPARQLIPPPAKRSALSMGFGNTAVPSLPSRPDAGVAALPSLPIRAAGDLIKQPSLPARLAQTLEAPPPVPLSSRPDLTALQASKPKPGISSIAPSSAAVTTAGNCLSCRNFTAPDNHAARFPRESLPSQDVNWLAHQLTDPFPSHTDKARAIFTWLHHNIAYDVVAFFGNNVKPATPKSTMATGLAVCAGYAGLFAAMAVKVGLDAVVVGGHGKGYGVTDLKPGEPVPPYSAGHAWNAVRIDDGFWKLIDPCWGAGVVNGAGQPYEKRFAAEHFTKSNEDFGLSHFPEETRFQFRNDGRVMTWPEYITSTKSGVGARTFNGYTDEEGIREQSFMPVQNPIVLANQGPTVRFSFQAVCAHYEPSKVGKPPHYLYVMSVDGLQKTQRNFCPFQNKDGIWWCDIATKDLGKPGEKVTVCAVSPWEDGDSHGLTIREYEAGRFNGGYAFGYAAQWTLA